VSPAPTRSSSYWLHDELATVLGIDEDLTAANADELFDVLSAAAAEARVPARGRCSSASTSACYDHRRPARPARCSSGVARGPLVRRPGSAHLPAGRVHRSRGARLPDNVERLLAVTSCPATFTGYLTALRERREHFIRHGAVSADVGVTDPSTLDLDAAEAGHLFQQVLGRLRDPRRAGRVFELTCCCNSPPLSVEDGLVLTVHAGVYRNHSTLT